MAERDQTRSAALVVDPGFRDDATPIGRILSTHGTPEAHAEYEPTRKGVAALTRERVKSGKQCRMNACPREAVLVALLDQAVAALDVATDALAAGTTMPDRAVLTAKLAAATGELRVAVGEAVEGSAAGETRREPRDA